MFRHEKRHEMFDRKESRLKDKLGTGKKTMNKVLNHLEKKNLKSSSLIDRKTVSFFVMEDSFFPAPDTQLVQSLNLDLCLSIVFNETIKIYARDF
jgi:hypothetical protein